MFSIRDWFSKKSASTETAEEGNSQKSKDSLEKAKHFAAIVDESIAKQNFSGLNQELSIIVDNGEKELYVFPHPSITWKAVAAMFRMVLLVGFLYIFFIGCLTAKFSVNYRAEALILIVVSLLMIFLNIKAICSALKDLQFQKRIDLYEDFLEYKNLEYIENLAQSTNRTEKMVISDLKQAIKEKLIPQGHFSNKNIVFMVSDRSYQKYLECPTIYNRYFEKELVKRAQEKSRPKPINDVLNRGNESIQKIKGYSVLIKDKSVSRNLLKIGNIVSMIFREIEADPNCINSLSLFLNYYLPTTEKLLNAYADLCQKEPNAYLSQPKKEIENALGTIISAYEQILEKLYKEHEMSITTEIETLKLMLKQEGVSV